MRIVARISLLAALGGCARAEENEPILVGMGVPDAGRHGSDASMSPGGDAEAGATAPDSGLEGQDDGGAVGPRTVQVEAGLAPSTAIIDEANGILASVKHTVYDHQTFIDEATGTFNVDCSGFVNFVLEQAAPADFEAFSLATLPRPLAKSYVSFIDPLPPGGKGGWHNVSSVWSLVPGDIIAWDEPAALHSSDTGHVMIVALPPEKGPTGVVVVIIDSSMEGHGTNDPRTVHHTSGVGEGPIVLVVDQDGAPTGYRWSNETASIAYTVPVALGHLE